MYAGVGDRVRATPIRVLMLKSPSSAAIALGPAILIRRAGLADLETIHAIEMAAFDRDRFPRRNLRRLLASGSAICLLAAQDVAPAGYALLLFRNGTGAARLYSVAVDPRFRGRGVGDSLIAAAGIAARDRGADRLRLELRPSNAGAMRLYQRAGFTFLERKPGYYHDGEDAVRMELLLGRDVQRAKGPPLHE